MSIGTHQWLFSIRRGTYHSPLVALDSVYPPLLPYLMPSNLDRIQCLLQPEAYAKVRTIAKHNRRALSAMASELIECALQQPKYKEQLEEAAIQVPVRPDPRTVIKQVGITAIKPEADPDRKTYVEMMAGMVEEEKLKKMLKVMEMMEMMEKMESNA